MPRRELDLAVKNLCFSREYTQQMLAGIQPDEWFQPGPAAVTHLAWQVGHLAMAEYGLTLLRLRGREPADEALISKAFIRKFQKGTTPNFETTNYPPIEEILSVFHRVHEQALAELALYQRDEELAESLPAPFAIYANKLGSVMFCPAHEMMHAGQIGLLRRILGKAPLR